MIKNKAFIILGIFLLLNCCNKNQSRSEADLKSEINFLHSCLNKSEEVYLNELKKKNLAENYSYQNLIYLLNNIDSATLSSIDPFINAIESKINKDVRLKINDKIADPVYIKFSLNKPENYRLDYIYADDTIHINEVKESSPTSVDISSRFELMLSNDFSSIEEMLIGNTQKMHDDGYGSIVRLNKKTGYVLPGGIVANREYIIFTFVKHKELDLFAKLVWNVKVK